MLNVQIIQPLVPEYRVPFFTALALSNQCDVQVFAGRTLPGCQSLRSVNTTAGFIHLDYPCLSFFNQRIFWQKGINIEKRLRPNDVLVVCGNLRFLSNFPLLWQAKRRKIATVWWGIGTMPNQNRFTAFLRRLIMRWTDVLLLYSDREIEKYKKLGFPADCLFATNNAIDQDPIQQAISYWTKERLEIFREQQGLVNKHMFLFCGRLSIKTKLELAIDALVHLASRHPDYYLAVIGGGEEDARLRQYAKNKSMDAHIRWLGPMYKEVEMAPWFLSSRGFVYPGNIGLSIMHAMGYGLPVITHNNLSNQFPEIVALRDGHNGLLFNENSAEDLADKMLFLSTTEAARKPMSDKAAKTATQDFEMSEMVRRFVEAIHAASTKVKESNAQQFNY